MKLPRVCSVQRVVSTPATAVGIARTEYMRDQRAISCWRGGCANQTLVRSQRIVSTLEKIFGWVRDGRAFQDTIIDNHLRENCTRPRELPFQRCSLLRQRQVFTGTILEQCNGCGGLPKQAASCAPRFHRET